MIWTATTGMRERLLWAWKTKPSDKTFRSKTYLPKACNFHVQMPGSLNWRTKHARKMFTRCGLAPAGWLRDGFDLGKRRRSLERQNLSGGKRTCPKHVIFMSKCLEVLMEDEACQENVYAMWPWGSLLAARWAKGLFKRPRRSHWCVASGWLLAAGWSMPSQRFKGFKVFKGLEGLEGFKGLRAGKRQAWTPIRSHWCVALGCLLAAGWSMPRDYLSGPEEAIDVWPWGGCWLQDEACQVSGWRVLRFLRVWSVWSVWRVLRV